MNKKALIFDLNGTMIDDMEFHLEAWYEILTKDLGASLSRSDVKSQMYGRNDELLERVFGKGYFSYEKINDISYEKERRYQKVYLPHLKLIDGLNDFLKVAHQKKIPLAIGSAALPFNIDFVLDNLSIREYFSAIVSANDVTKSKPHPETYLKAADLLNTDTSDCIVFEDAPKGVEAAENAGMKCIVITGMHQPAEFTKYQNIIDFIPDYLYFNMLKLGI